MLNLHLRTRHVFLVTIFWYKFYASFCPTLLKNFPINWFTCWIELCGHFLKNDPCLLGTTKNICFFWFLVNVSEVWGVEAERLNRHFSRSSLSVSTNAIPEESVSKCEVIFSLLIFIYRRHKPIAFSDSFCSLKIPRFGICVGRKVVCE